MTRPPWWFDCATALRLQDTLSAVAPKMARPTPMKDAAVKSLSQVNHSIDPVPGHQWSWCCHQTAWQSMPEASGHSKHPIAESHWPRSCHMPTSPNYWRGPFLRACFSYVVRTKKGPLLCHTCTWFVTRKAPCYLAVTWERRRTKILKGLCGVIGWFQVAADIGLPLK